MAVYSYKGLNQQGKEVNATVSSETEAIAKQKIRALGIMLIELKEKKAQTQSKSSFNFFSKKVPINQLSLMTRQFATLVKARIQVVEALSALASQIDHEYLRVVLSDVKTKVNEGSSLAKAMAQHPIVFNNIYCNMVEAGEASGTLDVVLVRLSEFSESQVKLGNKVKSAMTYPIIMATVGTLLISLIFLKVIPQIAKIFVSSKKKLPFLTEVVLGISDFMVHYWWFVFLAVGGLIILTKRYVNSPSGERRYHKLILALPVIGTLSRMVNVSRFCSTLGTLLAAGVPILAAMNIVKNLISNVWIRDAIEKSRDAISEGLSMTGPLIECGLFPSLVTHMIKLGESSGELENMLNIISNNYQEQVETQIGSLTSIIEPIMIIFMALIVGVIVFSVIMPMMELNKLK
ncbi:MAG: type II secretion system F family protein [Bacteriovoracaceae bacterium]|nr:type II secretion system F family protein [Bacteriovoracaceae bacterium]